jgi:hypothetical protein
MEWKWSLMMVEAEKEVEANTKVKECLGLGHLYILWFFIKYTMVNRIKRQQMGWEEIFASNKSGEKLIPKIHKVSKQFNSKKTNNSL